MSLRTLLQDRIAALNGRSVEHVLKQDKRAFTRLVLLSAVQVGGAGAGAGAVPSSLIQAFVQHLRACGPAACQLVPCSPALMAW